HRVTGPCRSSVAAHTGREDLLQSLPLLTGGPPDAVAPAGDRRGHRLQLAEVDVAGDRRPGHGPRGAVDGEPLGAGAGGTVVEDAVPHVVPAGDLVAGRVEAAVDRQRWLVAGHPALRMGGDVGHPLVD